MITLSPDTQAILLLCGSFGPDTPAKPLTVTEYSRLAQRLLEQKLRPADLLQPESGALLAGLADKKITSERIQALLKRGGTMALAVEQWTNKGLWILSRSDAAYPRQLKQRLKHLAPPLLYGAGRPELLGRGGLAMVGSRNVDEVGLEFTRTVARRCAAGGVAVISGGAKGVDITAMLTALEADGEVVGVLSHGLAQASRARKYRDGLQRGYLALVSPYSPNTGFSVGAAMGRNKYIYTLSDACLVVAAETSGGTWEGATENLKNRWTPLLVRDAGTIPTGNKQLMADGATPLPERELPGATEIAGWLMALSLPATPTAVATQGTLFGGTGVAESPTPYQPGNDLFELVWPYLASTLASPMNAEQLALSCGLVPAQAELWLKQAEAQGRATRLPGSDQYRV
jgi:predicted Rossmann fold nucleotide-binding protein DprA/Smf involved in DNA uptake